MLSINMSDVIDVLKSMQIHLIAIAVILVLGIAVMIGVRKMAKNKKYLIRSEAAISMVLAIVIVLNLISTGPLRTMLDLVSGRGTIEEATSEEAKDLVADIAREGIVLLKDEDNILPMAANSKLNVFGWASTNPIYGGAGSGSLNDAYPTTSLIEGLNLAGIETNGELTKFYSDYKADRPVVGMFEQDWTLPEPAGSLYTDELVGQAKEYSDTAMIVIGRGGGEGADLPTDMARLVNETNQGTKKDSIYDDSLNEGNDWDEGDHFLQLSNREEEMVEIVCSNFDNVILVYNGSNAFELGFADDYPQIKGVIWCASAGQNGFEGLGEIVSGEVNPSGKTIDTFVYDLKTTPTWNNFGSFYYDNMDEFEDTTKVSFINYVEGIYVGYKFYETAAVEGSIDYDTMVQYPFGYGLSYTTFNQEIINQTTDGDTITFDVEVTNTGTVAGKDVVEVYYNPPYQNGGIEKASANLVAFDKTDLLEPGSSEIVTISFAAEDMASYDAAGSGSYVLEEGNYTISINADSHTVIDSFEYMVEDNIVYDENNKRESDQVPAVNQFDFADSGITYLSRQDGFANYAEATAAPVNYSMSEESKSTFYNKNNYLTAEATAADEDPDALPITTGADNGLSLIDVRGLDYDDPKWDTLLDQLTLDEMNTLISLGGYQTAAVKSIGKLRTNDCDGPASINNNFTGTGSIGFPAGVMIAATWNSDLALEFGESIGKMADEMDVSGWYAPAMNIHRSAFAGRNFEYYSEDSVLSGEIAADAIIGAERYGVYAYIKHYALNDQETNRLDMLCTWTNEQALREIYLKPFEIAVKKGNAKAVMSAFNYVGNEWAGGSSALCNTVLRDEWGFRGMVLTDYFGVYSYMNADQAIRNGTDAMLTNHEVATNSVSFRDTNGAQQAMRTASKNILYVVANSRAYLEENMTSEMPLWQIVLISADAVAAVLLVCLQIFIIKGYKKRSVIEIEEE